MILLIFMNICKFNDFNISYEDLIAMSMQYYQTNHSILKYAFGGMLLVGHGYFCKFIPFFYRVTLGVVVETM